MKTTYCLERHESVLPKELTDELSYLEQSSVIWFHSYNWGLADVPQLYSARKRKSH